MYWPTRSSSVALQGLDALLADLAGVASVELLAGLEHDLAGIGVDQVDGGLEALQPLGVERHAPTAPSRS